MDTTDGSTTYQALLALQAEATRILMLDDLDYDGSNPSARDSLAAAIESLNEACDYQGEKEGLL